MDIFETIKNRRSVRAYLDKPVEQAKLDRILDAARLAPSANNRQMWKFIVVRDAGLRTQLANAAGQEHLAKASVVVAAVSLEPDRVMFCGVPSGPVDVAIALEHMALAATALGLGTCWIGRFDQDKCRKLLGVPDIARIIELMTLGYPDEEPDARPRKSVAEIVVYDQFS